MAQVSKRAFSSVFLLVTFALLLPTVSSEDVDKSATHKPDVDTSKVVVKPQEGNSNINNSNTNVQKPSAASDINCTNSNDTACGDLEGNDDGYFKQIMKKITENRDMLLRTMYVLFGVTGVVIIYFIARAWRLRRKRNKSRKYGVITTRGDLEMEPLGRGDEEDDDYTVFEMNGRHK